MQKRGYVYILTNKQYGVLYIGVTSNLAARVAAHREGKGGEFTSRYKIRMLVYFEEFPTISEAIAREKVVKAWKRMWKIRIIEEMNPSWDDLYLQLNN